MIKQIRYFQAVVRCKSFTEAAEECFISQSAISQQIQALEQALGVQLIWCLMTKGVPFLMNT